LVKSRLNRRAKQAFHPLTLDLLNWTLYIFQFFKKNLIYFFLFFYLLTLKLLEIGFHNLFQFFLFIRLYSSYNLKMC
jgi:hypothetical protein